MRVQIVGRTQGGVPNDWCVVSDDGLPVPAATRYLSHLANIEASPNTRRAYARDLADYYTFLERHGLELDDASNEVLGRFARWLRSPADNVWVMADADAVRSRRTVNRALTAVSSFYRHLGSFGPESVGHKGYQRLRDSASIFRRYDQGLLDNVRNARGLKGERLGPRLPEKPAPLSILTVQQAHTILEACPTYQYRLFFTLAFTTGLRMGQILGLRHEDLDTRNRTIIIRQRDDNENGARAKNRKVYKLPITREVVRLYTTYMHEQYGYIDSDYVFISLSGEHVGRALLPGTIYAAVDSIKARTGVVGWTPHTFRHTYVTLQRQAGVPIEVISNLVTHGSIQTTVDIYSHMSVEDLRAALVRAGAWEAEAS